MIIKNLLTKEQKEFMKKHQITEDLLIDANGGEMSEELKQSMAENQKVLAINVNSIHADADHDFINIDGLCVQHDLEKIPFAIRTYKTGYIYIAGSKKAHLIKVGSSNEVKDRIKTLDISTTKNAGFDDWELLFQAKTTTLGKVERLFQSKLSDYKSSSQFEKGRKLQNGGELYRCSYNKAKEVMTPVEGEEEFEFTQVTEIRHLLSEYQFKNLRAKTATPVAVEG